MAKRYAAGTTATRDKSLLDIERELHRFGADGFAYAWQGARAQVTFLLHNYQVRLELPLPDMDDPKRVLELGKELARAGRKKVPDNAADAVKLISQQRWRAMLLILKAKLVAITEEVRTFEQEFGMDIVIADGRTVGEYLQPQLEEGRRTGTLPKALPGIGGGSS